MLFRSSLSLKYSIHFLSVSLSPASSLSSFFLNFFFSLAHWPTSSSLICSADPPQAPSLISPSPIAQSVPLSLSLSLSTSPTHASAGLNVTNPSPKPPLGFIVEAAAAFLVVGFVGFSIDPSFGFFFFPTMDWWWWWLWLRKKIGDLSFFFFSLLWTGGGGGGVGGNCGCG